METPFRIWMTGCVAVVLSSVGAMGSDVDGEGREHIAHSSRYGVDETVLRLEAAAREHGLTVFARVPHRPRRATWATADEPVPSRSGGQVLVLASALGGTPVWMAGPDGHAEVRMRLLIRPTRNGGAEVLLDPLPTDRTWPDFPTEAWRELDELRLVVAQALM